ncbi:MAG: phosphoribosylaminoimidazolesuccinocarboxamide synthase [Pseudomonadales bacterium]|nr:phosphoribosylaminoimidazolesuccinocarboxamide synthase [Pseudomonadales bacterium]
MKQQAILETNLSLPNKRIGKVRDLYDLVLPNGDLGILIVATDRVSAFDVVMENGLPGKGIILTQLSKFWFEHFSDKIANHLVSTDVEDIAGISEEQRIQLRGRVMLCRVAKVIPIECIARGYITGSGWKDYQASGTVCGINLPEKLLNGSQLPSVLFTPSTKAETGHDENISFAQGAELVGAELMEWLQKQTISLYTQASEYAANRGIILADTKFEFGLLPGANKPILIDEIFTPDSSRFWPIDQWKPGQEQISYDKQIVRDYLETVVAAKNWDKMPPGPLLPESVIEATLARYIEAFRVLTGSEIGLV